MVGDRAEICNDVVGYISSIDKIKYPVFENGKIVDRVEEDTFRVRVGNRVFTYKAKYFKQIDSHHWVLIKNAI